MSYLLSGKTLRDWLAILSAQETEWRRIRWRWWSPCTHADKLVQWGLPEDHQARYQRLMQTYQTYQSLPRYKQWWHWFFNINDIRWKYQWLRYEKYHLVLSQLRERDIDANEIKSCFFQLPSTLRASCASLQESIQRTLFPLSPSQPSFGERIMLRNRYRQAKDDYKQLCQFLGVVHTWQELETAWNTRKNHYQVLCLTAQLLDKEASIKPIKQQLDPILDYYQQKINRLRGLFDKITEADKDRATKEKIITCLPWQEGINLLQERVNDSILEEKKIEHPEDTRTVPLAEVMTLLGFYHISPSRITAQRWQAQLTTAFYQLQEKLKLFYYKHADTEGFIQVQAQLNTLVATLDKEEQTLSRYTTGIKLSAVAYSTRQNLENYEAGEQRWRQWEKIWNAIEQTNRSSPLTPANQYYFDLLKAATFLELDEKEQIHLTIATLRQEQAALEVEYAAAGKEVAVLLNNNRDILIRLGSTPHPGTPCGLSPYWMQLAQSEGYNTRLDLQKFLLQRGPLSPGSVEENKSNMPSSYSSSTLPKAEVPVPIKRNRQSSFVHMVQQFAAFEFEGCDLLQLQTLPAQDDIEELPGNPHAFAAYAVIGQELYYIDKREKICKVVKIAPITLMHLLADLSLESPLQEPVQIDRCLIQSLTPKELAKIEMAAGMQYFTYEIFDYALFREAKLPSQDIQERLRKKIKQCKLLVHPDKRTTYKHGRLAHDKDLLDLVRNDKKNLCIKLDNTAGKLIIAISNPPTFHAGLDSATLEQARKTGRQSINQEIADIANMEGGIVRAQDLRESVIDLAREVQEFPHVSSSFSYDSLFKLNEMISKGRRIKNENSLIVFDSPKDGYRYIVSVLYPKDSLTFQSEVIAWREAAISDMLFIWNPKEDAWFGYFNKFSEGTVAHRINSYSIFAQALRFIISSKTADPWSLANLTRLLQQYILFPECFITTCMAPAHFETLTTTMQQAYALQQICYKEVAVQWLKESQSFLDDITKSLAGNRASSELLLEKNYQFIYQGQALLQASHDLLEDYPSLEAEARLGEGATEAAKHIQDIAKEIAKKMTPLKDMEIQYLRRKEIFLAEKMNDLEKEYQKLRVQMFSISKASPLSQMKQLLEMKNQFTQLDGKSVSKPLQNLLARGKGLGISLTLGHKANIESKEIYRGLLELYHQLEKYFLTLDIDIMTIPPQDYHLGLGFFINKAIYFVMEEWEKIFVHDPQSAMLAANVQEKLARLKKRNIAIPPQPAAVSVELCEVFPSKTSVEVFNNIADEKERNVALKLEIERYIQFLAKKKQVLNTYQEWIEQLNVLLLSLKTKTQTRSTISATKAASSTTTWAATRRVKSSSTLPSLAASPLGLLAYHEDAKASASPEVKPPKLASGVTTTSRS